MKYLTRQDIMRIADISEAWFYQLRNTGDVPPADDQSRTPFVWNADNQKLLEYFKKRGVDYDSSS